MYISKYRQNILVIFYQFIFLNITGSLTLPISILLSKLQGRQVIVTCVDLVSRACHNVFSVFIK